MLVRTCLFFMDCSWPLRSRGVAFPGETDWLQRGGCTAVEGVQDCYSLLNEGRTAASWSHGVLCTLPPLSISLFYSVAPQVERHPIPLHFPNTQYIQIHFSLSLLKACWVSLPLRTVVDAMWDEHPGCWLITRDVLSQGLLEKIGEPLTWVSSHLFLKTFLSPSGISMSVSDRDLGLSYDIFGVLNMVLKGLHVSRVSQILEICFPHSPLSLYTRCKCNSWVQ